jgi:hypothetical protein
MTAVEGVEDMQVARRGTDEVSQHHLAAITISRESTVVLYTTNMIS